MSTGEAYEYDQPTSVAHVGMQLCRSILTLALIRFIDTTPEELTQEIRRQYGEEAESWLNKRCQWIK